MTDQTEEIAEEVIEADQNLDTELGENEDQPIEEWQKEDESESEEYQVDGKLHQSMKSKLKGRVSARDEEIEKLKTENEALRLAGQKKAEPKVLTRPKAEDYNTDAEFDLELSKYDSQLAQETYNRNQAQTTQAATQKQAQEQITEAVDSHYERADQLIKDHPSIKEENYKKADENLRKAFASIRKDGDLIVDQLIAKLGKGSEKVTYFLGVNKPAQAKAQSLLSSDPTGMSLLVYLGEQKQRLTNPIKPRSGAPDPAPGLKGDVPASNTAGYNKLKKAYDKAGGAGNTKSYNIKKEAREAGHNTSTW